MSFISCKRRPTAPKRASRLDGIEPLEARIAPAVVASINNGTLTISLNTGSDSVTINALDAAGDSLQVAGTGLTSTTFNSVSGVVLDFAAANQTATATDSFGVFSLSKGFSIATVAGVTNAAFHDTTGGNAFDFSNWFGSGSITDSGNSPDIVSAVKSGNYTLSNTNLSSSDGMNLGLSNIATANLTDTGGGHSFTVSGWTFGGALIDTGATGDTVIASKSGGFTLSNSNLSSSDFMNLGLTKVTTANLTDTAGGNTFTLSGWTGGGSLTSSASAPDTVTASEFGNYTLSNTNLSSSGGLSVSLSNIKTANLTETAGGNSFTVSGWSFGGSLIDTGTNADTIVAAKSSSFTLSNSSLSSTDGLNLSLTKIGTANLTDTGGGNSFTVSGWTHGGSLADTGSAGDTVIASKSGNFTLTNSTLSTSDGMSLGLTKITVANLTDNGGGNTFTVSGWTHDGLLADTTATADTIVAVKNGGYAFSNAELSSSDGMDVSLSNIGIANLTDTGGVGNTFTVNGWTGGGALVDSNNSGAPDVITATEAGGFTLTNTGISSGVGLSLTLSNFGTANLTDTLGGNNFTVSGWTHGGSLTDSGTTPDTVIAAKNGSFNLGNFSLSNTDGTNLNLSNIATANLTDTGGGNTFTLSSWTGHGSLIDTNGTADIVAASEGGSYTLTNNSLSNSNGLNMSLSNIATANLTDSGGGNTFTVSGWTHGGSLIDTNGSPDTVVASKDASFSLSNKVLFSDDGMSLNLTNITTATLTDTAGGNSFTILGWTGGGSLNDAGAIADDLFASKASGFTLTNTNLSSPDGLHIGLTNIGSAALTDTAGGNTFTLNGWTGGGSLTDSGATADTVAASQAGSYTLTNTSLSNTSGLNVSLTNVATANLTETAGSANFDVSGWTHGGTLTDTSNVADTVLASKNANFTLANGNLSASDGLSLNLNSNIGMADLTDTGGGHSFTVSGWTKNGVLTNLGATADTVIASKNAGYTLSNLDLSSTDGMHLALSNISNPNLTDTGGGNSFDISGWTGSATLTSLGSSDTLIDQDDANFVLTNTSLQRTFQSGPVPAITLSNIGTVDLTGGPSGDTFDLSKWTGVATVTGGSGNDTLIVNYGPSGNNGDPSASVGLITFHGNGGNGDQIAFTGVGGEAIVWSPSDSVSNAGTFSANYASHSTVVHYDGVTGSVDVNNAASLALNTVQAENFTLDTGSGQASLTTSAGNAVTHAMLFTGVPILAVNLGTSESGADSSSLTINSLIGDSALKTLTVTTGIGSDTLQVNTGSLNLPTPGGSFTWIAGAGIDTIGASADVSMTLTPGALSLNGGGSISFPNLDVENANLTGGDSGNDFDLATWGGSATVTGGTGNDTLFIDYAHAGDPSASTGLVTFHGNGGTGDRIVFVGNGTENLVWNPSDTTSNAGALTIGYGSHSSTVDYDGLTLGFNISSAASLTLSTAKAESYALNGTGGGDAILSTSPGSAASQFMLFTDVPTVSINLGTGEPATDSSSLTIDSLVGEAALKTLAITTGAGADTLALVSAVTSLNLPSSGGEFSWVGGGGHDVLNAMAGVSMALSNTGLAYSGDSGGLIFSDSDIATAHLVDTTGGHTFTTTGWSGGGSLASLGAADSVTYQDTITNTDLPITVTQTVKHGKVSETINVTYAIGVVLTNSALYSTNGMDLSLSNIGSAKLTAGSGGNEAIDASHYTGTLALYGSSGVSGNNNDVLIAGLGVNTLHGGVQADRFVLTGLSVSDTLTPSLDAVNGVSGQRDLIDYSGAKDGLIVNLGKTGTAQAVNKSAALKGEGLLTLNGLFDDLEGSKYSDKLTGNLLSNEIYGGGGSDSLTGGGVPLPLAGQPKNHDFLFGNASTTFVHPAKALQEIDTTSRKNVSPFPTVFPIIIPDFVFAVIAEGASSDPFIISASSV